MRALLLLLLLVPLSCVDAVPGGECNVDGDCGSDNPTCVFDVNQAKSYCTKSCSGLNDCPRDMTCRLGVSQDLSGIEPEGLCIRQVRECGETDLCNGLDDDCNGVVDDPGCAVITACNDDLACGAFVCSAPEGQAATVCTPPVDGSKRYYDDCTADDECPNGVCSTGVCAPFCRARGDRTTECDGQRVCARGMASRERPDFNLCEVPCDTPSQCDAPTKCVWRNIHEPRDVDHVAVCSRLDSDRIPLGQACPSNTIDGDDMCQYGLCFQNVCTRICGGPGSDCSDLGPSFQCQVVDLHYGITYTHFVCRKN